MRKEEIIITLSMETLHVHLGNFLRYLINLNTFLTSGALKRKKKDRVFISTETFYAKMEAR